MNVLKNMIALYNQAPLGSTYRHTLQILLINLSSLTDVTVYDLAELTNTSRTTIWRLVKDMGYKSFAEFNSALSTSISKFSLYNRMDLGKAQAEPQKNLDRLVKYLTNGTKAFANIDLAKVEEIVDILHQKSRVSFYWMEGNPYIDALQQNLSMNGKETNLIANVPDMIGHSVSASADSIVFFRVLDFTETLDVMPIFATLQQQNSTVVLLSNDIESQYEKYADYHINSLFPEDITPGNVLCSTYFVALVTEIYRGKYIGKAY